MDIHTCKKRYKLHTSSLLPVAVDGTDHKTRVSHVAQITLVRITRFITIQIIKAKYNIHRTLRLLRLTRDIFLCTRST